MMTNAASFYEEDTNTLNNGAYYEPQLQQLDLSTLGADKVINYNETNWQHDPELKGADVVFDTVGETGGLQRAVNSGSMEPLLRLLISRLAGILLAILLYASVQSLRFVKIYLISHGRDFSAKNRAWER